jgi:hypothetical protein
MRRPSWRRFRRPPWSLALLAWVTAIAVQSGSFGTVDTWRRYQVTRSLWRGEPAITPGDYPDFGLVGVGGTVHAWYGIGQSLVMLPADLLAAATTSLLHVPVGLRHKIEVAMVAFTTFPLIAAANAALGYELLRRIGRFGPRTAALGVMAWIFGSTVLTYMQLHFENSLDLCLCLVCALGTFGWARSGRRRLLAVAALAAGFNALMRVPNLVDVSILLGFALASASPSRSEGRAAWWRSRALDIVTVWVPIIAASLVIDRAYQVARFGWDNLGTTYIHLYGLRERLRNPALPADFPFSVPFFEGLYRSLFDRNRSVLFFEPLAVVAALLLGRALLRWRSTKMPWAGRGPDRALLYFAGAVGVSFACRSVAFAKYVYREGGICWADRLALTPAQLLALLALPLFLAARPTLSRPARATLAAVFAWGVALALASIVVEPNLESLQQLHCQRPLNVIPDRFANIAREVLGSDPQGLSCNGSIPESYLRPALLPFGNGRDLPKGIQPFVLLAWLAILLSWSFALVNALRGVRALAVRSREQPAG